MKPPFPKRYTSQPVRDKLHYGLPGASIYSFTNGARLALTCHTFMENAVTKLQALIVDEHPSVRQALAKRLTNTDQIEVRATADTLSEAISVVQSHQPDVVILGLRVLDRDRDTSEISRMVDTISGWGAALVILTSYAVDDDRKAVLRAGARRYLLKDIDTERLILEIKHAVTESFSYAKRPRRNQPLSDADLPNTL